MRRRFRWIYTLSLPTVWFGIAAVNFHFPGDEYGGFAFTALPGLWVLLIRDDGGSPRDILPFILGAGLPIWYLLGFILDLLRVPGRIWAGIAFVTAPLVCAWALSQYPTWERAVSKNGSITAYVLPSLSCGLFTATAAMIVGTAPFRLFQRWRRPAVPSERSASKPGTGDHHPPHATTG